MDMLSLSGWAVLVAVLLGIITAAVLLTIRALREMSNKLNHLQEVMNGRLSQLVALTAVSSEAIGVEKGRLAEIARVISKTLPVEEPLLASTLAHFERKNGDDELVIPVPVPMPTVVLVPTETTEQAATTAAETAAKQVADLYQEVERDTPTITKGESNA